MLITFVVMCFFGACVLYDTFKHKKERPPVTRFIITLIGIASIGYGLINLLGYCENAGLI